MNLDIHDAVVMAVILSIVGGIMGIVMGIRRIRRGRKVAYYRISRRTMAAGWRVIVLSIALFGFAILLGRCAEPVAYRFFPPSPSPNPTFTVSLTPTISMTPTISLTPTITPTPQFSDTPTITPTPYLPMAAEVLFSSLVTPNPSAIFSPLTFSLAASDYQAINPQTVFQNPIQRILATYSYDNMTDGAQWTAVWYQNGELLAFETSPWEGGTGGYGQFELTMESSRWLPGVYQLVFFVGSEWKVLGEFRVMGDPPTPTSTRMPSQTPTITKTLVPTFTPFPSDTRWPSQTPTR
jgi:hypothetical protein